MSDQRKPFYNYAIARDSAGRYIGAWRFAAWALAFMPATAPAKAFEAYAAAQADALREVVRSLRVELETSDDETHGA